MPAIPKEKKMAEKHVDTLREVERANEVGGLDICWEDPFFFGWAPPPPTRRVRGGSVQMTGRLLLPLCIFPAKQEEEEI